MGNHQATPEISPEEQKLVMDNCPTVRGIAAKLARARRGSVIVMVGAGISVSAGIPDFRTPGTGLYDNLQKYNLPQPEAVFELSFFREKPTPFYTLCKELWPGNFNPTPTHKFIKLLQDKQLLKRCYTQNIDTLERVAGIDPELLVEAHGSFGAASCIDCEKPQTQDWFRERLFEWEDFDTLRCDACDGLVKPNIVFFGESLPDRFSVLSGPDLAECDLLIVMGTSLAVYPFAGLVHMAPPTAPRLLINRDQVGSFLLDSTDNYRDTALLGDCDDGVRLLADACGWSKEFAQLVGDDDGFELNDEMTGKLDKNWRRQLVELVSFDTEEGAIGCEVTINKTAVCVNGEGKIEAKGGDCLNLSLRLRRDSSDEQESSVLFVGTVAKGSLSVDKCVSKRQWAAPTTTPTSVDLPLPRLFAKTSSHDGSEDGELDEMEVEVWVFNGEKEVVARFGSVLITTNRAMRSTDDRGEAGRLAEELDRLRM